MHRFIKQFIIAFIFFSVLAGVSGWLWYLSRPKATCVDAIQNQDETGVDCGGICGIACIKEPEFKEVSVVSAIAIPVASGIYDTLGELENKNRDFGATNVSYTFDLLDATGTVVASRSGSTFALPGETKKIVAQRLETAEPVVSTRLTTADPAWLEVSDFPGADLLVRDKRFDILPNGAGSKVTAVIVNQSGYDFERIDIVVVLRDAAKKALAVGSTDVRILRSGEQRAFEIRWPEPFGDKVGSLDVEAYTNLLADENFIIRYGNRRTRAQEEEPAPPPIRFSH